MMPPTCGNVHALIRPARTKSDEKLSLTSEFRSFVKFVEGNDRA